MIVLGHYRSVIFSLLMPLVEADLHAEVEIPTLRVDTVA
jgi:hypothetical protein